VTKKLETSLKGKGKSTVFPPNPGKSLHLQEDEKEKSIG